MPLEVGLTSSNTSST